MLPPLTDAATAPPSGRLLGFLLFVVLVTSLPSQVLYWDGLGFLMWTNALDPDLGHLLYIPMLHGFELLVRPLTHSSEYAAKLLSAVGGGVALVLAWGNAEGRGLRGASVVAAVLLFMTTPLVWRQATIVEPTTWTLAALLLAARAAERWRERRDARRFLLFVGAVGLTLCFHLVSVLALPWLVLRARREGERPPLRLAFALAGVVVAAILCALPFELARQRMGDFWSHWLAFLPGAQAGSGASYPAHASLLFEVLTRGTPAVTALGLTGAFALVFLRRAALLEVASLALPYWLAFLLLGKPVVGLSLPLVLALWIAAVEALRALASRDLAARLAHALLVLLLALQVGWGVLWRLRGALSVDDHRVAAELIAGALPRDGVVLAGPIAHHLKWYTGAPVIVLPNVLHAALAREGDAFDPLATLSRAVAEARVAHASVWLTSEALDDLFVNWGFGARVGELAFEPAASLVLRAKPPLVLHRLSASREGSALESPSSTPDQGGGDERE